MNILENSGLSKVDPPPFSRFTKGQEVALAWHCHLYYKLSKSMTRLSKSAEAKTTEVASAQLYSVPYDANNINSILLI